VSYVPDRMSLYSTWLHDYNAAYRHGPEVSFEAANHRIQNQWGEKYPELVEQTLEFGRIFHARSLADDYDRSITQPQRYIVFEGENRRSSCTKAVSDQRLADKAEELGRDFLELPRSYEAPEDES